MTARGLAPENLKLDLLCTTKKPVKVEVEPEKKEAITMNSWWQKPKNKEPTRQDNIDFWYETDLGLSADKC